MALTAAEQEELARLEKEVGGDASYQSVLINPNQPQPTVLQQLGRSFVETLPELGGMVGGTVGALGTRSPTGARTGAAVGSAAVRSMIGAGAGGATGEAAQQAITGRPSLFGVAQSGIEQATYDAAGNLIFSAGGKAYRVTKDFIKSKLGSETAQIDNAIFQADRLLKQEGGFGLTPYQATGSQFEGIMESLARGSFTAKPIMAKADLATEKAIQSAKGKILDDISTSVYDSVATGKSFAESIEAGDTALKNTVRPFYDNLSKTTGAQVNLIPIQNQANQLLNQAEKAGGLTLTDSEKVFLTKISSAPEQIDFATSHDILSSFKKIQRDAKSSTQPDSALYGRITAFVNSLQKQMDSSFALVKDNTFGIPGQKAVTPSPLSFEGKLAEDQSQTLSDQYKFYSKLYREGMDDLYSDTTAKLLNKDPEFVGKTIYQNGSVTAFEETKKALGRAKQLDPKLNVTDTLNSVRRGYVENLLKNEGTLDKLGSKIETDEAVRRTFNTVLTKDQQTNVMKLLKAAELSAVRPGQTAPLFVAAQQAQAVTGVVGAGAILLNPEAQSAAANSPYATAVTAGAILFGPRFIAKAITDPAATNAAVSMLKQQEKGLPITANLAAKTFKVFEKAKITAEDLTQPTTETTSPAQTGLTDAEKEELIRLEKELQ
jgi:hypothetical protein